MSTLAADSAKNIAVFINDFDQEFADGLARLAGELHRPLRGILLIDQTVKYQERNVADTQGVFEEVICDFSDPVSIQTALAPYQENLLLATCSSERNQPYLAKLIPHIPYLLEPTESSLEWATHKSKMRELLASYDTALTPKTRTVHSSTGEEVKEVVRHLTFPVIVKPTGLAASILVSKAHDEAELAHILEQSFAVIHDIYERDSGRGKPSMIVEEFIEGDMYSTDAYVTHIGEVWVLPLLRSITGYEAGQDGFHIHQVDSYHDLDASNVNDGNFAVAQAIHALGLRACVVHIELFHTASGWKIIELGPRAGGQRQDIYHTAYGVDHAYNELRVKIGLRPEFSSQPQSYSSAVYFYADDEGILENVDGFESSSNQSSTYKLTQHAQPGDTVAPSSIGGKFVVRGVLTNKELPNLHEDINHLRSTIKIHTKKV